VGDLLGYQGLFVMQLTLAIISFIFVLSIQPFHYKKPETH
jgi:hypothetical protein